MSVDLYEGAILTVDKDDSVHRYLAVEDGKIAFVGDKLPAELADKPVQSLGGRALVPSFVDTHEHFASFSTFNAGLNVMEARSNAEIMEMVADFVAKSDAKTLIAFGASPYSVAEGRLLSREELDRVCPDRPMMMGKYDGHACVVNSKLLEKVDAKVRDLRGYHPDTGEMNQEAFFAVSDYITGSLSIPDLVANMQRGMDYLASKGIGMVHTVSGIGFAANLDITLEMLVGKGAQHGFQVRVFPQSMDVGVARVRRLPRIGGCFANALDGCFGSADAALIEPYIGTDDHGVLYYTDEQVIDFCRAAHDAGLQIEMHAIGDAAFDQATRCLKAAIDANPRADHRHGIIHDCLPTQEGIEICAAYGIQMPMQTSFIGWPQEPDSYLQELLGPERAARLNPIRTFWDKGIVVSAGSDAPCTDPDPIMWMDRAMNNPDETQRLTVREALRMCTYNGAWTTFDEDLRGSLEVGKIADMVLLSENPYEVPSDEIGRVKVDGLFLGGEPYKPQSQSVAGVVVRGLVSKARI